MNLAHGLKLAAATAMLLLAVPGAHAGMPTPPEQELGTVEQQLEFSRALQDRIAAEVEAALAEQEEVAQRLVLIARDIQSREAAIAAAEARVLRLNKEAIVIRAGLAAKQDVIAELLAGLQRLEQNPPPALVVEPGDVLAALRGAMMFGTIVPELRGEAEELARQLSGLERITTIVAAEKAAIRKEIAGLESAQAQVRGLAERKRLLAAAGNGRLEQEKDRAAELASKAKTLKQLIDGLAAERRRTEAQQAEKAAAEEIEKRRQEAALHKPAIEFSKARGRLDFPAQGSILKRFGDDDGLGGTIRGLAVATRDGAQVTAPAAGSVEFAGPFRSYGQLLILNAGGGYHILLSGMTDIGAAMGDFVRAGEPVGTMGTGPSPAALIGEQFQDGSPVLYIEFRKDGEAIDSAPWWIGGTKEARG
ncbi:MAG TPA: peptidoglycan DD-metalloendopeptidase family protein [Aestuariivirga sp.]|nr:peptidoglycan DD-metalloendopeptidase family protein [Aestuariivirga sp.]